MRWDYQDAASQFSYYNVSAHNVYYVKLTVKVLYFTIHIHTQINQYVVISDFPPVSVEKSTSVQ
ncbi:hypothetical protein DMY80_16135 [Escherichia coli]|nr:hypothetical protein [Escherichia coli]EGE1355373.1 hypothetical protein [Escherichia coli]